MTKLQLALDGDMASALRIMEAAHAFVDIVEVGTPLVIREGMHAVRRLRAEYPALPLVADLKIMDAGAYETDIALDAGADRVTVMAHADDATIRGAAAAANARGKLLMVDMMGFAQPLARARQLRSLGCQFFCLHRAHELRMEQGSPQGQLARLRAEMPAVTLAIAGGIRLPALDSILPHAPQVIIVGAAISAAAEPARAARQFQERLQRHALSRAD